MEKLYNLNDKNAIMVNKEVYSLNCVLKASYLFLDKAYIYIDKDETYYIVHIKPKEKDIDNTESVKQLIGEFQNELLNQEVKERVAESTKTIRELILARAMYSSYIENPESIEKVDEDYSIDEIAKDWFDNGDK